MESEDLFIESIRQKDLKRVQDLLRSDPCLIEVNTQEGISCIQLAAYTGNSEITGFLLENVSHLDIFESSALGILSELKRNLNDPATNPDAHSADGFTPLGLAAFFGHFEAVKLLYEFGAEINTHSRNSFKVTPLNSAAAAGHTDIARFLLEKGADPDSTQQQNITPLHSAAHNGNIILARLLLSYGADRSLADDNGKTPLTYAREMNHEELLSVLDKPEE